MHPIHQCPHISLDLGNFLLLFHGICYLLKLVFISDPFPLYKTFVGLVSYIPEIWNIFSIISYFLIYYCLNIIIHIPHIESLIFFLALELIDLFFKQRFFIYLRFRFCFSDLYLLAYFFRILFLSLNSLFICFLLKPLIFSHDSGDKLKGLEYGRPMLC
jgi:hypothetical protein